MFARRVQTTQSFSSKREILESGVNSDFYAFYLDKPRPDSIFSSSINIRHIAKVKCEKQL